MFKSFSLFFLLFCSLAFTVAGQKSIVKQEFIFENPPFKECHASTILEVSPGKLLASWFGGDHESHKNVEIWTSVWEKGKWSKPVSVADGVTPQERYPTWNPVLFKSKSGKVFLFYKVGPSPSDWWGMVKTSSDNGKTWSSAVRLPEGILGPIKNKPEQLADGTIISPSSTETNRKKTGVDSWKAHVEISKDDGKTWKLVQVDPGTPFNVIQPSVLKYPGNRLQILCRSKDDAIVESWSTDGGNTWSKMAKINLLNPNSGTDAVTLRDGRQVLIYNPTVRGKQWDNGRQKLNVAVSVDGKDWKDIAILEDEKKGEFSYPAVIQAADGKVHITYTYNRTNVRHVVLQP